MKELKKGIFSCFLAGLCILLLTGRAEAATFCVSTSGELHGTLTAATSNGEDDVIQIVQGTYVGRFVYASTEPFNLTIGGGYTAGCASRTVDAANTVFDGNQKGTVLVLSCDQPVDFLVDGLTIQNGSATLNGGGLYILSANGNITLTNNSIRYNTASRYGGGGVYLHDADTVILTNNTISNNTAGSYGYGGGIDLYADTVTLTNNTISNNTIGYDGGGIRLHLYENSDSADIYNNIIWNNSAGGEGNDLYITNDVNGDYIPSVVNLFNNDFDRSASGTYIELPFSIDPSNLDNLDPFFVDSPNP